MRHLSRRKFLTLTGAAFASMGAAVVAACTRLAPTAAPSGAASGGAGTAATTAAVPAADAGLAPTIEVLGPAGSPLVEPAVRTSAGGVLDTTLRVAKGTVPMGDGEMITTSYEDSYPGPTLELGAGETLRVALVNDGEDPTNLHTHGFHVSPKKNSDNVLLHIMPGETFDYEYDLPTDHPAGTYWYHSHMHMYSDEQVFNGQFGMLIVRGEFDELPGIKGLAEKVLILSGNEIKDGVVVPGPDSSLSNQVTVVNGQHQPEFTIAAGEVQRWRLLNAGIVFLRLALDGAPMVLVANDGNSLTASQEVDEILLGPGMRADVLVVGGDEGSTMTLRSLSFEAWDPFWTPNMVPVPQDVLTVRVEGGVDAPAALPTKLLPMEDLRRAEVDRTRVFTLEEREPRGVGPNDAFTYYINGTIFDPDVVNAQMELGTTEEWMFINRTYEPHPLHIHVNPFQIVEINGEPATDEHSYRDTAIIPAFGTLKIRHRFDDYTGKFVMHCHILFHEDHGMMQVLEVVPPGKMDPDLDQPSLTNPPR